MEPEELGAARLRKTIADAFLGESSADSHVGNIKLMPHQVEAVSRSLAALDEFGGALLCDPVGTGKTFVALALADAHSTTPVVAPAVLRDMWVAAAQACKRAILFVSFEALSRGFKVGSPSRYVIIDEAHHLRNPATARFAAVAELVAGRRVFMMSATPIHNRRRDLVTLLSLFLGSRAQSLSAAEIGRCVLRRDDVGRGTSGAMPLVEPVRWTTISYRRDPNIPELILALPPPLPPRDGGDGGMLVAHSLIRQWASSNAALAGGLKRRLRQSASLIAALEDGTYPSKHELGSWISADDGSIQLGFSSLLAPASGLTNELLPIISAHHDAVRHLLGLVKLQAGVDDERARIIRSIQSAHAGVKVVAFSQYSDTVKAMFGRLNRYGGAAALDGKGGTIASGRISRRDVIEAFAPAASGVRARGPGEKVDLLLTTDLLSEGVNLQDAGVVIHLDLPWTPARVEQRLGRIARIGSRHARACSYAIRPPADSASLIRLEDILISKMRAAGIVISKFASLSFETSPVQDSENYPIKIEAIREAVGKWRQLPSAMQGTGTDVVAINCGTAGFLATCRVQSSVCLIACVDGCISDKPYDILKAVRLCDGPAMIVPSSVVDSHRSRLEQHLAALDAFDTPIATAMSTARRSAINRIARAANRARVHDRVTMSRLVRAARNAIHEAAGAQFEIDLERITRVIVDDNQFLQAIVTTATSYACNLKRRSDSATILEIIVFTATHSTNALPAATER